MEVLFTCNDGDLLNLEELVTSDTHTGKGESRETPCAPLLGERITYLYRVAPGLAYSSNAAQCAAIFGLPGSTVARAQYVSKLLATHDLHKLLEEQMSEAELRDLQVAEEVARRFLGWDLTSEVAAHQTSVRAQLGRVLGQDVDHDKVQSDIRKHSVLQ